MAGRCQAAIGQAVMLASQRAMRPLSIIQYSTPFERISRQWFTLGAGGALGAVHGHLGGFFG